MLFTVGKLVRARSMPSAARGNRCCCRSAAPRRCSGFARRSNAARRDGSPPATDDSVQPDQQPPAPAPSDSCEIAGFSFHAALLMSFGRCAELAVEAPMRPKCDELGCLFPALTAQDFLHRSLQVVVAES